MNKKFKKRFKKDFMMFYLGIGLYIFFLVLWFLTLPKLEVVKSLDDMNVSEQIKAVKEIEQKISDESNYLIAKATDNNFYCEIIEDVKLKRKCFKEVISFEEIVPDNRTEQDIIDESNFLLASVMNDISYCDSIVNIDLKEHCLYVVRNEEAEFIDDGFSEGNN